MIQRIQSVLILIAILANVAILFVPMWSVLDGAGEPAGVLYGMKIGLADGNSISLTEHGLLAVHAGIVLIVAAYLIFVIFQFNDRLKQIKLAYAGIVLLMVQVILSIFLERKVADIVGFDNEWNGRVGVGFFLPLAAIALVWVAINRIKSDEELVKSVDRFR